MLAMGFDAVWIGRFQGAGRESSETSGMCVAGCYKMMEKASALGSRRKLDNVSQDNRSSLCRRGSAAGRGARCVAALWVGVCVSSAVRANVGAPAIEDRNQNGAEPIAGCDGFWSGR